MKIRLSKYEKQAFRAIKITCSPNSLMGIAVQNVIDEPTAENIRDLLISIFTQGKDNQPMMVAMLGFFDAPSFIAHHCKTDRTLRDIYSKFLYA
jgi:hypothetical protein